VAEAQRGLEGDLAIEARVEEVQAAMARERGETALDEVQVRLREEYRSRTRPAATRTTTSATSTTTVTGAESEDHDHSLRVMARIPVPNPREVRARRGLRRSDTAASLARLEETALIRRSELCFTSIESAAHTEQTVIYEDYARQQRALLERNEERRRSGSQSERTSTRFEVENRIKLATRMPGPAPQVEAVVRDLPRLEAPTGRLVRAHAVVRETVGEHNPSAAVHVAVSDRYAALSAREESRRWPWFDFVDLAYEREVTGDDDEIGAQIALRIPFGAKARGNLDRYRALRKSQSLERERLVEENVRRSLFALEELDHFETHVEQWEELLTLARKADEVAERGWREQLARLSQIASLFEQAYEARIAVLEARERAGMASCTLLAMTGVPPEDWPRK
jgi:hypothetical protein